MSEYGLTPVAAGFQHHRRPEGTDLLQVRFPFEDLPSENGAEQFILAYLGVKATDEALDHRFVDFADGRQWLPRSCLVFTHLKTQLGEVRWQSTGQPTARHSSRARQASLPDQLVEPHRSRPAGAFAPFESPIAARG